MYSLFEGRRPGRQVSWQWSVCSSNRPEIGNHLPPAPISPNPQTKHKFPKWKDWTIDEDERTVNATIDGWIVVPIDKTIIFLWKILINVHAFASKLKLILLCSWENSSGNVIKSTMRPARQFTFPTVHMKSNCITSASHPPLILSSFPGNVQPTSPRIAPRYHFFAKITKTPSSWKAEYGGPCHSLPVEKCKKIKKCHRTPETR